MFEIPFEIESSVGIQYLLHLHIEKCLQNNLTNFTIRMLVPKKYEFHNLLNEFLDYKMLKLQNLGILVIIGYNHWNNMQIICFVKKHTNMNWLIKLQFFKTHKYNLGKQNNDNNNTNNVGKTQILPQIHVTYECDETNANIFKHKTENHKTKQCIYHIFKCKLIDNI